MNKHDLIYSGPSLQLYNAVCACGRKHIHIRHTRLAVRWHTTKHLRSRDILNYVEAQ